MKKRNYDEILLSIIDQNAPSEQIIEAYKIALKESYKKLALYEIYFKLAYIFFIFFIFVAIDFTITYTEIATYPILTYTLKYVIIAPFKFIWIYILMPIANFSWNYIVIPIGTFFYYEIMPNILPMTKSFFIFFWNYIIVAPTLFIWNYFVIAPINFILNHYILSIGFFACLSYILFEVFKISNIEKLEKDAKSGNINAQFKLGALYEEGNIVKKNLSTAYYWYEKAATQGHVQSKQKIKELNKK